MSFFDDDPFDSIVREFFGASPIRSGSKRQRFISSESEDRTIDFVEDDDYVYLVFELPGFSEKDVSVIVKGRELVVSAQSKSGGDIQDYLNKRLSQGLVIKKQLPNFVSPKKFKNTMRNGILEVVFNKSGS